MDATELFKADGKPAGIWFCSHCRHVKCTQSEAEACCSAKLCPDCGGPSGMREYATRCDKCRFLHELRLERERFEKAEKVTLWDGPVYTERAGVGERFGSDIGELLDSLADLGEEDEDATITRLDLEYVWTCHRQPICTLDLDSILENASEQHAPEDWSYDDLDGIKELEAALDKFNEANKGAVSWTPNFKVALLLTPSTK